MGFYRKKPVVIEAFRWTGGPDQEEDPVWLIEAMKKGTVVVGGIYEGSAILSDERFIAPVLIIRTLIGNHEASPGDWIIKGAEGELYPCKDSIFTATYDPVPEKT